MQVIHDVAGGRGGGVLLVMLPGALHKPEDLVREKFIDAMRERNLPVSVAVPDAHVGYYLDRDLAARLEAGVIAPARRAGYRQIWLMGISLGGLGALLCARACPDVERVILLAPYLGVPGLIDEIVRAGGLAAWEPGAIAERDDERRVLAWLKHRDGNASPRIYVGYGRDDRFAPASRLLEPHLQPSDVIVSAGGHDWTTWRALWEGLLERGAAAPR